MKFVEYPEEKKTEPGKDPEGNVQGGRMPNGNMFWTIILMFAFLVLINTFLFPGGKGNSVVETDYGSFISDVDSGRVYDVVIDGDKVMYSKNAPLSYQERLKGQRDTTYITGAISDPDFVSRLSSAKSPGKGGKSRENNISGNDEREQTLNQLLTEMDGFDGNKGVIILAATNRPDSLDKALLRPGRFDRRVQMELPDLQGRKAILQVHLKDIRHEDIDLDLIGRATAGSSGAELANIVNEAALRAVRLGKKAATTEDLEESVEVVMAGEQRKNAVISAEEKRIIAYHEIGHAMVAAAQNNSAPVQKITIIPRTSGALGYTMQVDEGEKFLYSKDYLLNRLATLTGGRVAEEVICHTCTTGASNDIEKATQMARSMITTYGMSDKYGMMALETQGNSYLGGSSRPACSDETAADIDTEVREMIAEAKKKATEIIGSHLDKMHKCAEYLLEKETITGEEFMKIFNS